MATDPIARLIGELGRLPGVGERSAARLAYYIIRASRQHHGYSLANDLAQALLEVEAQVGLCDQCQNLCAQQTCSVCLDPKRDATLLCVVEGVADLRAMERSGGFRGLYHVLHGVLSPLDGVGPEELKVENLVARVASLGVQEVVLATNANVEGDATALYLSQVLGHEGVQVTRLATGIPQGGELEYLDGPTLAVALSQRRLFGGR